MSNLPESKPITVAYFISPHGFGHAARAAAVMDALHRIKPSICFDIYTTVPRWFFEECLAGPYTYTAVFTDVGMVQQTPFREDLPATVEGLDQMLPFDRESIELLAVKTGRRQCKLVLCDIAPMGIAAARAAGIASVLVENFTWDWVYQGYSHQVDGMIPHIEYLKKIFADADYHIQTQPVCNSVTADLTTLPVSRKSRVQAKDIRRQLALPDDAKLVMLSLGGAPNKNGHLNRLPVLENQYFIIPGAAETHTVSDNVIRLPHQSQYYHPDLIQACDAVIGKVGYSTLAEVYHSGLPFGYIPHARFRESARLEAFINDQMHGFPVTEEQLRTGVREELLHDLMALPRIARNGFNGADQIAEFVSGILEGD